MIEEQALCRVHRVGQRRNVTTIRYLMRNSFEEVSFINCIIEEEGKQKTHSHAASGGNPETEEKAGGLNIWIGRVGRGWHWTWNSAGKISSMSRIKYSNLYEVSQIRSRMSSANKPFHGLLGI